MPTLTETKRIRNRKAMAGRVRKVREKAKRDRLRTDRKTVGFYSCRRCFLVLSRERLSLKR